MKGILSWALARLKEPSTYAALTAILVGLGVMTAPEAASISEAITNLLESGDSAGLAAGALFTALAAVFLKEKSEDE